MGSAVSSNTINSLVNVSTKVATDYNNNCTNAVTQNIEVNILPGCDNFTAGDITNGSVTVVNTACLQDVNVSTQMQTDISQAMKQAAESVVSGLGIGGANAQNVINNSVTIGNEILNYYTVSCTNSVGQSVKINCSAPGAQIGNITNKNYQAALMNCIQRGLSTSDAVTQLKQVIDQTATAKVDGGLGLIAVIVVLIVIIVIIVVIS